MSAKEQVEICFSKIRDFCEANNYNDETQKLLNKFLGNLLQRRRTPTSLEMDLKLETLHNLSNGNDTLAQQHILKAIEGGWLTFYPLNNNKTRQLNQ